MITARQKKILKIVVKEFMKSAEPVGSVTLSKKYDLGISPATLRAEMGKLVDEGYLYKEHSSSGRIPTTMGLRFFLNEMLKEKQIDKVKETKLKEKLFQRRFNKSQFIKEAVKALSEISGQTAFSLVDDIVFSSGVGHLVSEPEFEDMKLLQTALDVIESESILKSLFEKFSHENKMRALIGDEIGMDSMDECGIVYAPYRYFRGTEGYIAVLGPRRMPYGKVFPAVRTISSFIEEAIRGWD